MAKQMIKKERVLSVNGILDINEDNEYIVIVDDEQYYLTDLLEDMKGTEISLKCTETIG